MTTVKKFVLGLIVGILIAFPLGINFGRGMPLLSNPFAKADIQEKVKAKAEHLVEGTKDAIHDATGPVRQPSKTR